MRNSSMLDIDPVVEIDQEADGFLSSSMGYSFHIALIFTKYSLIYVFTLTKFISWLSMSIENQFRKYLADKFSLSPRESGSKWNLILALVKCSAISMSSVSIFPRISQLTSSTHFSSFSGAYSQQSCILRPSQTISLRLTRFGCLAICRKWSIFCIIQYCSSVSKCRVFLTTGRVYSVIVPLNFPKGQAYFIQRTRGCDIGRKYNLINSIKMTYRHHCLRGSNCLLLGRIQGCFTKI